MRIRNYRALFPLTLDEIQRFYSHLTRSADGCWLWSTDRCDAHTYGQVSLRGRTWMAHRIAWELLVGPIPDGLVVDHLCRRPACCNPAHLDLVTPSVNVRRGNRPRASAHYNARKTTCKRGHPLSGDNLYIRHDHRGAHRVCKTCVALFSRESRERKSAPAARQGNAGTVAHMGDVSHMRDCPQPFRPSSPQEGNTGTGANYRDLSVIRACPQFSVHRSRTLSPAFPPFIAARGKHGDWCELP